LLEFTDVTDSYIFNYKCLSRKIPSVEEGILTILGKLGEWVIKTVVKGD
jgi:hypothetical protein